MKVAIIKYNAGNVVSVNFALERLGITPIITDDITILQSADKVIFPGVGEASTTMKYLKNKQLDKIITSLQQPVLGICLGMQLLCQHSEEGDTDCLGIFPLKVRHFNSQKNNQQVDLKVPHVGWNTLENLQSPLLQNLPTQNPYVYYVHSFYVEQGEPTIASTQYILPFSAALHQNNFYAVQFHPEKSGEVGAKILENFLTLK
jgi:glutamine amidotransferase